VTGPNAGAIIPFFASQELQFFDGLVLTYTLGYGVSLGTAANPGLDARIATEACTLSNLSFNFSRDPLNPTTPNTGTLTIQVLRQYGGCQSPYEISSMAFTTPISSIYQSGLCHVDTVDTEVMAPGEGYTILVTTQDYIDSATLNFILSVAVTLTPITLAPI
jgi:hypothetical protein